MMIDTHKLVYYRSDGEVMSTPISRSRYDELQQAREVLLAAIALEDSFEILLENFREYEQDTLTISLDFIIRPWLDGGEMLHSITLLNRRVLNLLASCRAYLDSAPQTLGRMFSGQTLDDKKAYLRSCCHEKYDSSLSYRLLESIRNYSQHNGQAVIGSSIRQQWNDEHTEASNQIRIKAHIERMRSDRNTKPSFREELARLDSDLDLKPHIRSYISSLGEIHTAIRQAIQEHITYYRQLLLNALQQEGRYEETVWIDILQEDDMDVPSGTTIRLLHIERYDWYTKRNRHLTHYAKHFVSSEVVKKKGQKRKE